MEYTIANDGSWIRCNQCGKTSHNPNDVARRYCGYCHRFLLTGSEASAGVSVGLSPTAAPAYDSPESAEWLRQRAATEVPAYDPVSPERSAPPEPEYVTPEAPEPSPSYDPSPSYEPSPSYDPPTPADSGFDSSSTDNSGTA